MSERTDTQDERTRHVTQSIRALAVGNERRLAQADLLRWVRGLAKDRARQQVATLLLSEPVEQLGALSVWRLLTAIPRAGTVRVRGWFREAGVQENKRLRELTPGQRKALSDAVR